ncbi:MAG: hypothetical protein J1E36_06485 [Eubacterium sp.]|nr:hypothetical protein [Eubacterium sp.]
MEQFIKYIESNLPDSGKNELLFKFKRKLLDEMNERYSEVLQRGISNQKVITDLIISEHPDIEQEYKEFYKSKTAVAKAKRNALLNLIGSVAYIFGIIILFLAVSFITHHWGQTWLIVVDGILLWVTYLLSLGVKKISSMRRIFHIIARAFLAMDVMVMSVAVFLFTLVMTDFSKSWIIVIAGVALMFVCDGIYINVTGKKLKLINHLVYIPVVSVMLYIILSALGVLAWSSGWLLIILSLILDVVITYMSFAENKKIKHEVIDSWKEN